MRTCIPLNRRWDEENVPAVAVSGRQADPDRAPPTYAGRREPRRVPGVRGGWAAA